MLIIVFIGLYNSNTAQKSSAWNHEQLTLFSHLESNYTFTYSGDERDDKGNFKMMIININTNYPHILFNINGGDLSSEAVQLYNFKNDYLIPGKVVRFDKPVIFVIGNHELQKDPSGQIYQSLFGSPTYYNFTEKNSYFIIIDNANGESLNDTQMKWLKEQLNQSQNYKYRFIFMHTPLYNPNADEEEHSMDVNGPGGADTLKGLFDSNNVTMIFASHIHNYYTGIWGKTPFIISGGAGAPAEIGHPPNHHYIVINVTDAGVNYTLVHY
ncbi:MAG: metallophosphoesterase [Methanobacterium sp.]|nr:metallophosphoesterase [Methanobacterium sp.]